MKFLKLVFSFLLVASGTLSAQNQNVIRVGVGMNVRDGLSDGSNLKIGPSLFVEYGREINHFFSIALNIHTDMSKYDDYANLHSLGISVRSLFTPFPKIFRWVKVGVGATYERRRDIYGTELSVDDAIVGMKYHQISSNYWGIDFPIRAYAIDNKRFELYAFYNLKTMFAEGKYFWNYSNGGIAFGVKF
ncbi:hypothetical protein [Alistipes finegoldii]|uniref:hypothetical protein n=1 Tax=Alistipes finegoldii TaxID=214856 RepID=UPI00189C523A|nr:hypothetical protein [Alistipes finegoldii]